MSNTVPEVGDNVCIDHIKEGVFHYGKITKIDHEAGLVYAVVCMEGLEGEEEYEPVDSHEEVCGDIPTMRQNETWVIDSF